MHVLVKLQSITECLSVEFEKIEKKDNEMNHVDQELTVESIKHTYVAKTCILNQNITGSILFKMFMWLPYKKLNLTLSEMFDLSTEESNYICQIERNNFDNVDNSNNLNDENIINDRNYTVDIKGHIKQKLRRFVRDENGTNISFHFRMDATHKNNTDNVLVLSKKGQRQWQEQIKKLICDASYQICDNISRLRNKNIHICDISIHPLPDAPPWEIQLDHYDKPTKVKIQNLNYPMKMDLRLKVNGFSFMTT
jgi:hypothetical protein